jgi:nucleoside 2-deoxyribosyltransferase
MTADEARDAITRHLERMDRAECIFVFNKDGYLGNSVVMEIGYAYAQRKPVYVLAPIQDPFLGSGDSALSWGAEMITGHYR